MSLTQEIGAIYFRQATRLHGKISPYELSFVYILRLAAGYFIPSVLYGCEEQAGGMSERQHSPVHWPNIKLSARASLIILS